MRFLPNINLVAIAVIFEYLRVQCVYLTALTSFQVLMCIFVHLCSLRFVVPVSWVGIYTIILSPISVGCLPTIDGRRSPVCLPPQSPPTLETLLA
uniref:Uncharacterized protein n=1 Tax=Arundo donax TaxID=35708 RepID=A0A0A9H9E1_ARUDO